MSILQIQAAIPHRPPMLLLDEILHKSADSITCRKTFRDDEPFVQGHYPNQPLVPGVILCEVALQAGAVLLADHVPPPNGRVPVATRLNQVKFQRLVRPGDSVEVEVRLIDRLADAFFMTGRIICHGRLAARLDFACALTEM
jgi:3-hydroxyacyl-[acyl-carrier-protein] dehydratase